MATKKVAGWRGPGSGKLPELKNLVDKSPDDLLRTLQRFNLQPDMNEVDRAANRAFDRVDKLLEGGHVPDAATLERVRATITKEITGTIRKQVKGAIRNYKFARMEEMGFTKYAWIAVVLGSCPSCLTRHGKVKTMPQWEQYGLPGSAVLICEADCRCHLVPSVV